MVSSMWIVGASSDAHAAQAHPGEPLSSIPVLRNGFGTIEIPDDATTPNGLVGSPAECGDAEGAAAYGIDLDEPARLAVTVSDLDAQGVCAVGLYALHNGDDEMTSLYDVDRRAAFTKLEVACAESCEIAQRLEAEPHVLVVWPAGSGAVSRRFSVIGTLRGFVEMIGSLTGLAVDPCRRVDVGGVTTLTFQVAPVPEPEAAQVVVQRVIRRSAAIEDLGVAPLDAEGRGALTVTSGPRGYQDIDVRFAGSETREPRLIHRCLIARGSARAGLEPVGYRFQYDDYSVWRDGDRMAIRVRIGPGDAARGDLVMRILRNVGHHRYVPFDVRRGIEVVGGLAVFRIPAVHRPNGLPFYRLRAEWPGSNTYEPANSAWMCFQVNR